MKKLYFMMALILCAMSATAQNYNLFSASDIDKDGWLWFDTQAKVDKYVGTCDEENYKADPNGKKIQLVYADQLPNYPQTTVDSEAIGFGKGGELGTEGFKKGAIILPAASAAMQTNGGGILIMMPSCSELSINVSCESKVGFQLCSTTDISTTFTKYQVRGAWSPMFGAFANAGNTTKTGLETKTNGNDNITIKSDKPVYVYFRNITKSEVYIHGIKVVTTTKNEEGGEVTPEPSNDYTVKFTAETSDTEREVSVALSAPGKVSIDWGDGVKKETNIEAAFDGWNQTAITGKVTGEVKIYADNLVYLECPSKIDGAGITSIDLSKATALEQLFLSGNKLTTLDVTHNTALKKLEPQNNKLTALDITKNTALERLDVTNNLISSIDFTKNTKLYYLKISDNKFEGALDLSGNTSLANVYALNMGITEVNLGENKADKPYFSFNNNKLTSFDASKLDNLSGGSLFLIGNQIKSFTMPAGGNIKTLNISKNCMTLETLPIFTSKGYNYAPQADLAVNESYNVKDVIDLSAQTSAALNTKYALVKADKTALTEGTDYTVADGKITVLTQQTAVYVTMTSDAFSKFSGNNIFKTTTFSVADPTGISDINAYNEVKIRYNIAGQRVNGAYNGIAIGTNGKKYVVK